ncbi:MAG TPA: RIP metalloprotease RseP [Terracidiphilus sp.]|jgi:regulator of sigma E protease|nr:RIP metalloprotease RseP [Terracidiphilus sp.]
MHEFLVAALAFIVLIGIMVVVHEFGHFAVAKLCGVRVESFSVGFGPRLFGIKHGETDYKVCLLPLGGYVKMTGENPGEDQLADDPAAFSAHPRWQRMLIGVAGPFSNFVLAFVLMVIYFGWINEVPDIKNATLEWVTPSSAAADAGLEPGDVFRQFGKVKNPDFEALIDLTRDGVNQTVPVVVERNGQTISTSLHIPDKSTRTGFELSQTGMYLQYAHGVIGVDQTVPGSPAERAGLKGGDSIVAVDGHAFHTVDPLLDYLQQGQGKPVTLTLQRGGVAIPPVVVHPSVQEGQWRLGFMPVLPADPPMHERPMTFGDAVGESRDFCADNSLLIVDVLKKLLTRQASVKQLAGPVGIAHAAGQAAETKYWAPKFGLAAGISLNLGILNLLPFPILDGGLIVLLLIESALRHDISMVVKERIYQAAFVVLVMFFAYVSFNDVAKLSVFSHLKP